jgi:hypothetical protein
VSKDRRGDIVCRTVLTLTLTQVEVSSPLKLFKVESHHLTDGQRPFWIYQGRVSSDMAPKTRTKMVDSEVKRTDPACLVSQSEW